MKKIVSLLALAAGVAASIPTFAAQTAYGTSSTTSYNAAPNSYASPAATGTPNTINASFGDYDFDKNGGRDSVDYRLEYEWGASLIPMMNRDWASLDRWVEVHPILGFEGTGDGMTYFNGGLGADVPLGSKIVFSWDEAMGLYGHGDSRQSLDSAFEVRSQLELGWKFDNNMRLSGYISHMSNFDTGNKNPGAEVLGAYLKVPVSWLAH